MVDPDILKSPVTLMYTKSINSDVSCPHCKRSFRLCTHCGKTGHTEPNCYAKNNPSNHQSKAIGLTSKHQHSSNLTMTEEDEDAIYDFTADGECLFLSPTPLNLLSPQYVNCTKFNTTSSKSNDYNTSLHNNLSSRTEQMKLESPLGHILSSSSGQYKVLQVNTPH
ncbi:hypothetical protein PSTG_07043 [Puccinia striiformis f. sp. tritici PST-78]|uniref:CCHC-type domain-containing protein n=1 Tax=Puccinia striiformis f. sp. tritici PST-78 TaxID=1165861 RepID=A0A0L0VKK8_9BASI|nr:hypothetical protein PSTG_07043 [Puccinia striiformis f. sp. tritici PST-78]